MRVIWSLFLYTSLTLNAELGSPNGEQCLLVAGMRQCVCSPGWTGSFCTVPMNCQNTGCANGGMCIQFAMGFECMCPIGFAGERCQFSDLCAPSFCLNGGTCFMDLSGMPTCHCVTGYEGKMCERFATAMQCVEHNPCLYGATCLSQPDVASPICVCAPYFTACCVVSLGKYCEHAVNPCHNYNPCSNGGTCMRGPNGIQCMCSAAFIGDLCQYPRWPCSVAVSNPCSNGGICYLSIYKQVLCLCPPDTSGLTCTRVLTAGKFCRTHPHWCLGHGVCEQSGAAVRCKCDAGWSGTHCSILLATHATRETLIGRTSATYGTSAVDEEIMNIACFNGGTVDATSATCLCAMGFTGQRCEASISDICNPNPCQYGGTCLPNKNTANCACPAGVTGMRCENVDELCQMKACLNSGSCLIKFAADGSVVPYCVCAASFAGDRCELKSSACTNSIDCKNGGTCSLTYGGEHICHCATGYLGYHCQHMDVCGIGTSGCHDTGTRTCVIDAKTGIAACLCETGYWGQFCEQTARHSLQSISYPCGSMTCPLGKVCVTRLGGLTECIPTKINAEAITNPCIKIQCRDFEKCVLDPLTNRASCQAVPLPLSFLPPAEQYINRVASWQPADPLLGVESHLVQFHATAEIRPSGAGPVWVWICVVFLLIFTGLLVSLIVWYACYKLKSRKQTINCMTSSRSIQTTPSFFPPIQSQSKLMQYQQPSTAQYAIGIEPSRRASIAQRIRQSEFPTDFSSFSQETRSATDDEPATLPESRPSNSSSRGRHRSGEHSHMGTMQLHEASTWAHYQHTSQPTQRAGGEWSPEPESELSSVNTYRPIMSSYNSSFERAQLHPWERLDTAAQLMEPLDTAGHIDDYGCSHLKTTHELEHDNNMRTMQLGTTHSHDGHSAMFDRTPDHSMIINRTQSDPTMEQHRTGRHSDNLRMAYKIEDHSSSEHQLLVYPQSREQIKPLAELQPGEVPVRGRSVSFIEGLFNETSVERSQLRSEQPPKSALRGASFLSSSPLQVVSTPSAPFKQAGCATAPAAKISLTSAYKAGLLIMATQHEQSLEERKNPPIIVLEPKAATDKRQGGGHDYPTIVANPDIPSSIREKIPRPTIERRSTHSLHCLPLQLNVASSHGSRSTLLQPSTEMWVQNNACLQHSQTPFS